MENSGKVILSDNKLFPTNKLKITSAGTGAVSASAFNTIMRIVIDDGSFIYIKELLGNVDIVHASCKEI